jgi:hypothetical protein
MRGITRVAASGASGRDGRMVFTAAEFEGRPAGTQSLVGECDRPEVEASTDNRFADDASQLSLK